MNPKPPTTTSYHIAIQQKRAWRYLVNKNLPEISVWNIYISSNINISKLVDAIHACTCKNETFRLVYEQYDGLEVPVTQVTSQTMPQLLQTTLNSSQRLEIANSAYNNGQPFSLFLISETPQLLKLEFYLPALSFDKTSYRIFFEALCSAYSNPQSVDYGVDGIQFIDFSEWQNDVLMEEAEQGRAYWNRVIKTCTPVNIPYAKPNGQLLPVYVVKSVAVLSSVTSKIQQFCKNNQTDLYTFLLSAYSILLRKLCDFEVIPIGIKANGRIADEVQTLYGFLDQFIPLVIDTASNVTFKQLLNAISTEKENSYKWQLFYNALQFADEKGLPIDHMPFLFDLEETSSTLQNGEVCFYAQTSFDSFQDHDLALQGLYNRSNNSLTLNFSFNTKSYDEVYIDFFTSQYLNILDKLLGEKEEHLDGLPVISNEEVSLILDNFNHPQYYLSDSEFLLHQLFQKQAQLSPQNIAVVDGEKQYTYREIDHLSNGVASYLLTRDVMTGDIIGLLTERSAYTIIGILGILKAGAAYLPLSVMYPAERIAIMLEVTSARKVLMQQKLTSLIPSGSIQQIFIDTDPNVAIPLDSTLQNPALSPDDIAYVIFTSGSTGKPKACLLTHSNAVNYTLAIRREKLVGNFVFFTTITFDFTLTGIFGSLMNGKTLFVFSEEHHLDEVLTKCFSEETGIDSIKLTPSHILMLDNLDVVSTKIQLVVSGGEALTKTHVDIIRKKAPLARLVNHYGPTETTVGCLTGILGTDTDRIYLGKPLSNIRAYITDGAGALSPIGIPGEILIGGKGVGAGYLNASDLTAERFINDPWDSGIAYRTGDIGRWLPDGKIEYLGRKDFQVKIRGHRIEPGEIAECITSFVGIDKAVVLTDKDNQGGNILIAYFTTKSGNDIPRASLVQHISGLLPDYMVPTFIVRVNNIPVNQNGKLDTKALLAIDYRLQQPDHRDTAQNPTQIVLTSIWQEVLSITNIGIHDNFFEVGGHSLLAMQLISRIREALNIEVQLRDLFRYPTIKGLQEYIDNDGIRPRKMPTFKKIAADTPVQMSYAQKRLWFLHLLNPGNTMYNMPVTMKLSGFIDAQALKQSFDYLCKRHAILRTVFSSEEDILLQIVKEQPFIDYFSAYDLSSLTADALEAKLEEIGSVERTHVFNLETGPLLTAKLIKADINTSYLFLNIHHIIMDEWSANIFTNELIACYNAIAAGRQPEFKENKFSYADFAHWQAQLIAQTGPLQIAFWRKKLEGITPSMSLPFAKKRADIKSHRGGVIPFTLPEELSINVRQFSIKEQSSMFMTLYSVFALLLHKYTGAFDLQVGTPVANRNYKEVENLIGFFVNTLVLRTSFNDSYTFKDLVDHVKNETIEAFAHQDIPFEELVKELNIEREKDYAPMFQTFFAVHNEGGQKLEFDGITIQDIPVHERQAKFDIVFSIDDKPRLQGYIEYNADLFDEDDMKRFCAHFEHLLNQVITKPLVPLKDISLVTDAEQNLILGDWNATQQNYPADSVAAMITQQALRSPQSAALVSGTNILTYAELEDQSNCLSHHLLQQVSKASVIAVYMDRSPQMIVCFLAILKAGCAYLALDISHPDDHINFLLEDSEAVLVLADAANKGRLNDGLRIITLEDVSFAGYLPGEHIVNVQPTDAAYVIYTSGSTGRPKGTTIHHKALQNLVQWHNSTFNITAIDHCTQVASISFDASIFEIWPPLIAGAALHIINKELLLDIKALQRKVIEQKFSVCFWPTPLAELMFALDWPANMPLRYVHIGGDKLRQKPDRQLPFTIIDNYGLAESCVVNISGVVSTNPDEPATIGRPIANNCVLILDNHLQLVPAGVYGEICIAGDGLTLNGYNNQPKLNHERFIPNPFAAIPYPTLYKTGDIGTYTDTGEIKFLERVDRQVKIRGHRIELAEVESCLMKHPDISDAAVICSNEFGADNILFGFYVSAEPSVSIEEELKTFLNLKLPAYMVPAALFRLPSIPVTEHYKTDFKALGQQASEWYSAEKPLCDADKFTPAEKKLAGLWSSLLTHVTVKKNDDFFDLGGHSLLVIKLRSRVAETYSLDVPVSFFFDNSGLSAMAAGLDMLVAELKPTASEPITIERVSRQQYKI
ncbi:non-ribosomal peptide synthetase [Daejeonella sp.]|uniref:non-ribosomal peptide synthetase n=1 Tax=Daejeonella sp. TaxID=2805397 RepID=UPI002730E9AC|nr:non-ribosomal peptide synthetase [Daejeonella sp.]MDP2414102.1 amino acid adenylation domain-containing protein [Daejeonella sp.]